MDYSDRLLMIKPPLGIVASGLHLLIEFSLFQYDALALPSLLLPLEHLSFPACYLS